MKPQHRIWHRIAATVLLLTPTALAQGIFPAPPPGGTLAEGFFTSPTVVLIPDLGMGTSPIEVSGLPGTVWDVNVVTDISHTSPADLSVVLIAPSGKEVRLAGGVGRTLFGLTLDDSATTPVFVDEGTYVAPDTAFSTLVGEDPNGIWSLRCRDSLIGDHGEFTWQLEIATIDVEPVRQVSAHALAAPATGHGVLSTTIDVAATGFVCDVDVVLHVSHPMPRSLSLLLYSPNDERTCYLNAGRGTVPDFYANATFDDSSTELARYATEGVPLGTVSPLTSLGVFTDIEANGTWRLAIGSGDTGLISVLGWELSITTCGASAPQTFCSGAAPALCPCGNAGAPDKGCANATHAGGARLAALVPGGGAQVGSDVVLAASDLDPFQIVLFVQGTQAGGGGGGLPLGDGLLCTTGSIVRLGVRGSGLGSTSYPGLFDLPLSRRGMIPPSGGTRVYQAFYRSPVLFGPCHTGINSTNGVRLTWTPQVP